MRRLSTLFLILILCSLIASPTIGELVGASEPDFSLIEPYDIHVSYWHTSPDAITENTTIIIVSPENRTYATGNLTLMVNVGVKEIDLDGYGSAFLLDTAPVSSQVPEEADHAEFVSLPLAANFTFANLTVVVYHTLIFEDGHQLDIKVGWLDALNQPHISHFSYESLEAETQVTMHSFAVDCCGIVVFEGERLWVELQTSSSNIHLFWGTLTRDSRVSYHGAATFIPEFPSFAVSLVLIFLTLIAVGARARFQRT